MRNGFGFTETDMNMGFIDLELLSPDQRGDGGEDDPADLEHGDGLPEGTHCVVKFGDTKERAVRTSESLGDGVWRYRRY